MSKIKTNNIKSCDLKDEIIRTIEDKHKKVNKVLTEGNVVKILSREFEKQSTKVENPVESEPYSTKKGTTQIKRLINVRTIKT